MENTNKNTIEFLTTRNSIEGFNLEDYSYIKDEFNPYSETIIRTKEVRAEGVELLFRLKNPLGKIEVQTIKEVPLLDEDGLDTGKLKYCLARAFVYLNKDDENYISTEIASAEMDLVNPQINVEVAAHTFAKLKALKRLGYGAEYGFEVSAYGGPAKNGESSKEVLPQELEKLIYSPAPSNDVAEDKSEDKNESSPDSLMNAYNVICHSKGVEGMTLGMINEKMPFYIDILCGSADDPVIRDAAILIRDSR